MNKDTEKAATELIGGCFTFLLRAAKWALKVWLATWIVLHLLRAQTPPPAGCQCNDEQPDVAAAVLR